ncbi:carbohydrate binding domain-containing protein [Lederbergia panacisoli]|uniref:carbohydrate binding domain-containing protein n=1 Tax=Lederbergia panacisoli TaxID=1255251 RepID=UPI00214C0617|nr:carbohydrate binding domain-containing protein [Lederbergia panacisoli]MCR2823784.1 carbohydrate binding domain-containing protein [Lederbergia panacisoli]
MIKKIGHLFLILLLVGSNLSGIVPRVHAEKIDQESTLYLVSGDEESRLSLEAGTNEELDVLHSEEKLVYIIDQVNGEYNGSGQTSAKLYLNGLAIAIGTIAKMSYDFNGDGTWDRTEETEMVPTDGDLQSIELFERDFTSNIEGNEYANFTNGKIQVEIYKLFGDGDIEVKVNAPDESSRIILPYSIELGGGDSDNGEGSEVPGNGDPVDLGNENSGNGDTSSDTGNGDDQSDPGNGDTSSDIGNGDDQSEPGNEDTSSDTGNGDNPTDPGIEDSSPDTGNQDNSSDKGNDDHPSELVNNKVSETPGDKEWKLVWEDNFDGNELDGSKWNITTGNGHAEGIPGWGNEEKQYYQKENLKVEDGKLIIEGKKESVSDKYGSYNYTSGLIDTRGKFSQKYGKFEAKMKLPKGQGYWPAFWMMPEHDVYGGWAISGEIDIMEAAGARPNIVGGAIHYGGQWPNNTYTAKDYIFPEGSDNTEFNVYSLEWEPGEIRWYVNGELYQKLNNWHATDANGNKYSYPAPFDQEFHIILNLAVGGWYGGDPDGTTVFPGNMEVEYVRAYELPEYREPVEPGFDAGELPSNAKEAIDGNYLYDPKYEQGFANISTPDELANDWTNDYWNFVYLNEFGGNASISVDQMGDDRFAKVDIANAGNQVHSVQLIQNATLGTGRWYKLSFDAKSNANRNLTVKIGGGPERGYAGYSPTGDFALSSNLDTYELTFQMQQESDPLARVEFNMGTNNAPVWIGNAVLEEIEAVDPYNENKPKTPLRNGNHVYNGSFDQGRMDRMTYWNFIDNDGNATASVSEKTRELKVDITNGGDRQEAIQVLQKGINLLANDEYELTFKGRADSARTIGISFISEDGTKTYAEEKVDLSTSMDVKTFKFTMPDLTDIASQIVFHLGGNNSNVYLDDIKLIRLTNNNAGLTLEEAFPLRNGDFSNGLMNWDKHIQGDHDGHGSKATVEAVNDEASITVENVGYNPWDIQLLYPGMKLKENQTYIVEFDAKSTNNRKIEVVLDNGAPAYHRYFEKVIDLTDTMETYTFEVKMPANDTAGLQFLLGNVAGENISAVHNVFIDNVRLEVKGERDKYFPLKNGDFSKGLEVWDQHIQGNYDGDSSATIIGENGQAKATIDNVGVNPWDIQLMQGISLYQNKYIVEFDAKSSDDRKIEVIVENASYKRYFDEVISLTNSMETYTFEFDMPVDEQVSLKFLLGNVENPEIDGAHEVYIDNVKVDVKKARELLAGKAPEPEQPEEPGDGDDGDHSDKTWKEIGENLIIDGSFETTTEFGNSENIVKGWNIHNQGQFEQWAGLADFSVKDGKLHADIQQVGWEWWHIQLFQEGIVVPSGMYKIEFDLQSERERPVYVELTGSGVPNQTFNVDQTMQTYQAIIEVKSDGEYKLMFGLGRAGSDPDVAAPYNVTIDNVKLVEVEEVTGGEDPGDGDPGDGDSDPGDGDGDPGDGDSDPGDGDGDPGDGDGDPGDGDGDPGDGDQDPGDGDGNPGDGDQDPSDGDQDPGNGDKNPGDGDKGTGDKGKDQKGDDQKKLPNTATSMYTSLLIGIVMFLVGIASFIIRRRKAIV